MALWEDHLLPLLKCKDAGRLACTCKALRGVVREHYKDLGSFKMDKLQAALATFPRARQLTLYHHLSEQEPDAEALVQWLREGGRGRSLEGFQILSRSCKDLLHKALQAGPSPRS
jgi:hypothetical protein